MKEPEIDKSRDGENGHAVPRAPIYVFSDSFQPRIPVDRSSCLAGSELGQHVEQIIVQIEKLGIRVNRSSRLREYQELLSSNTPKFAEGEEVTFNWALLECLQFSVIVRSLEMLEANSCWLPKLQSAVTGATFANDDSESSRARSDQCELYFMGMLLHAGFAVELGEPDLLVKLSDKETLAMAVKRPRSEKKVFKNIRAGIRQLPIGGPAGVVAIDLSFIEHVAKPLYIYEAVNEQVPAAILLDGYARENWLDLLRAGRGPNTLGLLLHLSCGVRSLRPNLAMISRRWLFVANEFDPRVDKLTRAIQSLGAKSSSPNGR